MVIKIKPSYWELFKKSLNNLYQVLEELQKEYSSNYMVNEINDPILQTTIMDFLKEMTLNDS